MTTQGSLDAQLRATLGAGYELQRELSGGGMSRVFVAREQALNREVVIKVLPPELAAGVNQERFRREIQVAAQLQHPHIVPLLSAGNQGELIYYTMPFIAGESLKHAIERGEKFSPRDALRILHDVTDALAYAHERGVIHRDIKPANVLRSGSHAVVTDFGVAKAISAALPAVGMTTSGMAIGTPAYMAPEQLAGDPKADHRMDIYAVGLLAYEILTGEAPFIASSPQETMAAQLTRSPAPISRSRPDVPDTFGGIIAKCLEKDPAKRPQTARELYLALDQLAATSGDFAPMRRRGSTALIYAGAAVVAFSAIALAWRARMAVAPPVVDTVPTIVAKPLTRADSLAIAKALAPRPKPDTTRKSATVAKAPAAPAPPPLPSGITPAMDSMARVARLLAAERPADTYVGPSSDIVSREAFAERFANLGPARPLLVVVRSTRGRPDLDTTALRVVDFVRRGVNPPNAPARFVPLDAPPLRQDIDFEAKAVDSLGRAAGAEVVVLVSASPRRDSSLSLSAMVRDLTAIDNYATRSAQMRWMADSAQAHTNMLAQNIRRALEQVDRAPRRGFVDPVRRAFDDRAANMGPPRRVLVANHPPDRVPAVQEAGSTVMDVLRHSLSQSTRFKPIGRDSTLAALQRSRENSTLRGMLNPDVLISIRANPTGADSLVWVVTINDVTAVRGLEQRTIAGQRVALANPMASVASLIAQVLSTLDAMDRAPRAPTPARP